MGPTIRTVDLVRSWLGQALRATGAAVVVPVAILVALSLTAVGGSGLGGLGALSQVVSGPRAAGSDVTVDDGDAEIGERRHPAGRRRPGRARRAGARGTLTARRCPRARWRWRRRGRPADDPGARRRRRPGRAAAAAGARRRWRRRRHARAAGAARARDNPASSTASARRVKDVTAGTPVATDGRGRRRRPRRGLRPARLPLVGAAFLPDLDRDLLDRQRDRRLGLGGAHAHGARAVAVDQPVGDRRAERLERLERALGRRQRDLLADVARSRSCPRPGR